jgi:HEAT repeat protein
MQAEADVCSRCGARASADARTFDEKLVSALKHPLSSVRARICWVMGHRGDKESVPHLRRIMRQDEDLFVRLAAISALGELGGEDTVEALEEAASLEEGAIAGAARSALLRLGR